MRIYRTETRKIEVVTDICCDICGKSCIGSCGNFCGIRFVVSGGYDSPVFPDDEATRHYDVCEICADKWLKTWPKDYLLLGTSSNNNGIEACK